MRNGRLDRGPLVEQVVQAPIRTRAVDDAPRNLRPLPVLLRVDSKRSPVPLLGPRVVVLTGSTRWSSVPLLELKFPLVELYSAVRFLLLPVPWGTSLHSPAATGAEQLPPS